VNLFDKLKRTVGIKRKYTVQEIRKEGNLIAAVLLSEDERSTLSKEERLKRFKQWHDEQR
jgi:hypothetical protein